MRAHNKSLKQTCWLSCFLLTYDLWYSKGLSVEQKDLPTGAGSLAPPLCGLKKEVNVKTIHDMRPWDSFYLNASIYASEYSERAGR